MTVAMLFAQSPVFAQAAAPATTPKTTGELEEVVVTGIRAGLRNSLEIKRESIQIVDAISAEDIGDFPDKNLSEALQRVTGVQISRQDGEGRSVSVRGAEANLVRVEINGTGALPLSVGAGDRAVDFRDLPVEFVSRIEVVKTPTADMTEGGISTVRIVTRRPFDSPEPYIAGSAQAVYSDLAEQTDPKLAVFGSRLFLDGTLGALLSLQWEKRHLYDSVANTTGWNRFASGTAVPPVCSASPARGALRNDFNADGTCDWYPQIPRFQNNRRETERRAFSTVLEWRPTDDFKAFWDLTYARGKEDVNNSLLQLNADGGLFDYANTTVGADNTVTHIELTGNGANGTFPLDLSYRSILGSLTRAQYTTVLGTQWDVGQFTLDGRVDYSNAKVHNDEINSTATVFGLTRAVVDYTGSLGAPNITIPGVDLNSGQGVNRIDAVYNPRDNNTDEISASFNVAYRPANLNWLQLKAGIQQHNYETDQVLRQKTVRVSCRPADAASANNVVAAQVPCATLEGIMDATARTNPLEFFSTGDLGYPNGTRYWNESTYATIAAVLAAGGAANPLAGTLDPYATNTNTNTQGTFLAYLDNWSVEEKTTGYFTQAQFEFPDLALPLSGNVGVRYVDTETNSSGYTRVQQGSVITFPVGSIDGGYTQALPSMNLKVSLLPETLVARFAAAKVMARPSPSQLAIRRSLDIVGLTGSRGNPALLPFLSTDFDLGLEWYFSAESYASLAAFRKEISRFILNQSQDEVSELDGRTYSVSRPVNGDDKVTINGIEGGIQYAFDFLPAPLDGFGVLANYTYQKDKGFSQRNLIDGSALSFPGLSRESYNYSLYFENEAFSLRASYNWRSSWLITALGRGNLPEFNRAYGQVDASAGYNITPSLSLFLEGINLTNEQLVQENAPARPIQFETFGKRYFFGVRGKF